MAILTNRNSILEAIRNNPASVRRLWIESGFENVSEELIEEAKKYGISFRILPKEAFIRQFKDIKSHVCLERGEIEYSDPDGFLGEISVMRTPFVCVLDAIYDPQNFGNIIRTAACFDVTGIILPKDRSCSVTPSVISVSRGGIERIKLIRVVNISRYIEELKRIGIFCYALDEKGEKSIWMTDLTGPLCLVFGAEKGIRQLTKKKCDEIIKIPTAVNFPSLNVASSFAIAVSEARRQQIAGRRTHDREMDR
ncbi:MAG: RNA methyltransferase [Syntrophorhabdaceae bacterium]|nr:RNA methyltransferase [Syntrophorhabdaceae bacterium]